MERSESEAQSAGDAAQLYDALVGADQRLITLMRNALAAEDEDIEALLEPGTAEYSALLRFSAETPSGHDDLSEAELLEPKDETTSEALTTALAIRNLARGLAGALGAEEACAAFLTDSASSGLESVGAALVSPSAPYRSGSNQALRNTLVHLIGRGDQPARGFAILMALELVGMRPKVIRAARVPVLFATSEGGQAGTLTLSQLKGGPSGLHPDPASMAFLKADKAVVDSIAAAWAATRLAETDACLVWSITVGSGQPAKLVKGGSMGAAYAVALDDLAPRSTSLHRVLKRIPAVEQSLARLLRPRTLATDCAVTAGLDGLNLTEVTGYGEKLAAAQQHSLRVVVSANRLQAARQEVPTGYPQDRVSGAATLADAIRLTRTVLNPALPVAVISAVIITAIVGVGGYFWRESALRSERTTVAASLATKANELVNRDSRMSALLALAADRLDPTAASKNAMVNAIQNNQAAIASAQAAVGSPVTSAAASSEVVLTADRSRTVKSWKIADLTPLGEITVDDIPIGMASGSNDSFAILTQRSLSLYQGSGERIPVLVKTIPTPPSFDVTSEVQYGPYIDDSGAVMAIDENGNGVFWSPRVRDGTTFTTRLFGGVAAVGGPRVVRGSAEAPGRMSVLLAVDGVGVQRLTIEDSVATTTETTTLIHPYQLRDVVTALGYGPAYAGGDEDSVMVGTRRGIQWWDPNTSSTVEFPYAGMSEEVQRLLPGLYTGGVTVVTPTGLKLLRDSGVTALNNTGGGDTAGIVTAIAEAGDGQLVVGRTDGRIVLLDPRFRRLGLEDRPKSNAIAFTPDGLLLVTSSDGPQRVSSLNVATVPSPEQSSGTGYVPDAAAKQYMLPTDDGVAPYVNDIGASDEYIIASGGTNTTKRGRVWVWDRQSPDDVRTLDLSHSLGTGFDLAATVAIAPELHRISALNLGSGEVGIWSTDDWARLDTIDTRGDLKWNDNVATTMAASADGSTLIVQVTTRDNGSVQKLIDVATGDVRELALQGRAVLSPDGTRIAARKDGQDVAIYGLDGQQLGGRVDVRADYTDILWSHDGKRLAVIVPDADQIVFVDAETMQLDGPPWKSVNGARPYLGAWSPDGQMFGFTSSVYRDGKLDPGPVQIFKPGAVDWTDALCAIAGTDLTNDEWRTYAGTGIDQPTLCPSG